MNLSVCTISFRHQLISLEQVVAWASANHFSGIELWGAHARNLVNQPQFDEQWLNAKGLHAVMISDYLPVEGDTHAAHTQVRELCNLADHWGAKKIRTFAGNRSSDSVTPCERRVITDRLRGYCDHLREHGLQLIIEIHPNTLADTIQSTQQLLLEVDQPNLKINFDVLHVWEAFADPIEALETLRPHIRHFHFKNIRSREELAVFSPPNVYAAAGSREGMVPLFKGAVDYRTFITYLVAKGQELNELDASLEWFGHNVKQVLNLDRYQLQKRDQTTLFGR